MKRATKDARKATAEKIQAKHRWCLKMDAAERSKAQLPAKRTDKRKERRVEAILLALQLKDIARLSALGKIMAIFGYEVEA